MEKLGSLMTKIGVILYLRWLPTVQPIIGHFSDTTMQMNISYFFNPT